MRTGVKAQRSPGFVDIEQSQSGDQRMLGNVDARGECGNLVAKRVELIGCHWIGQSHDLGHFHIMHIHVFRSSSAG
jgi:hypothetical protein